MATLIERSSNPRLVRTPCGTVRTPWRHEGSSWFWFYSLARYPVGSVLVTCSRLGTKTWKTYRLIKKSGQNLWCGCKVSWPWCSERRGQLLSILRDQQMGQSTQRARKASWRLFCCSTSHLQQSQSSAISAGDPHLEWWFRTLPAVDFLEPQNTGEKKIGCCETRLPYSIQWGLKWGKLVVLWVPCDDHN